MILFTAIRTKVIEYCLGILFEQLNSNLNEIPNVPIIRIGEIAKKIESSSGVFYNCRLIREFNHTIFGQKYSAIILDLNGKPTSVLLDNNTKIYY